MADKAEVKARKAVRQAQSAFERTGEQHERARKARREAFEQARAAGMSMRDIAKETGLHFTRVAQVLQQKP